MASCGGERRVNVRSASFNRQIISSTGLATENGWLARPGRFGSRHSHGRSYPQISIRGKHVLMPLQREHARNFLCDCGANVRPRSPASVRRLQQRPNAQENRETWRSTDRQVA